ncbi:hypothetical protein BCV69DRAFT_273615 [Microstroma glucosiphilum]|uniref:Uncharacterized protein n=1 Tax=Pseudomicrostroma glucosiphilum TaxID=1684307 RepID=A0A316TZP6_9BASI|nr:hypothetical protein BCV69DRAFT_273615 [Pseudomicrostroma glucosiphilum]PWN18642.1 hypothetical protein BCV69DRAFT_273615 [Pseudomicrostroma glucosiphilum]
MAMAASAINSAEHQGAANGQHDAVYVPPPQLQSLVALADTIASQPERFALSKGDSKVTNDSLQALKDVFADALASEGDSLQHIGDFLHATLEAPTPPTRSAKSKKRKRQAQRFAPHHSLFPPTPLSGLVVDGMEEAQIWEQLEFRGRAIENVLSKILIPTGADASEVPEDEVELKANSDEEEEEGDEADPDEEQMIRHISALSDAELRAVGIDPALRDQLLAGDDDFQPDDDEQDDDIEDEHADGYPGASDYSSDEEEEGYEPGASKRVYVEPLKTEKEQRRKKELDEMQAMGGRGAYVHEEDEYEDDEDEDDEDEDESEEEEEEEAQPPSKRSKSLLDSLDEAGTTAGPSRRKGPRHPTLDDEFFSIDDFNRQTEEDERREIFKEAGEGGDSDDEELDLFQAVEGEHNGMDLDEEEEEEEDLDANDPTNIRFADFFLPPASAPKSGGRGSADRRAKGKGKGSRVGEGAKLAKQERDRLLSDAGEEEEEADEEETSQGSAGGEDEEGFSSSESEEEGPARPNTRVKFAPTVAIRKIKSRRNRYDDMSQLQMLQAMSAQSAEGEDEDEDEDEGGEEDEDEEEEGTEDEEEEEEEDDHDEEMDESDAPSESAAGESALDEDLEDETARRFAGDLFEDGDEDEEEAQGSKLSAHEKRLANLQKEIARLESENVGAKDWTLAGEASSRARPKDSLLEENLDFEQSAKATPTITIESTESLEALIKRRILENQFDDVVPRRAIAQAEYKADYELSDKKSGKSLAEEYENDFQLANSNAGGDAPEFKGESQIRLEKDRAEVEDLMDDIFNRLDALSNAHFIPKAPKMRITTLSNTPTLNVQEGLPTSTSSLETSQLAPQEVFNLSSGSNASVLQGDKSELTPAEKQGLFKRKKQELKKVQAEREVQRQEKRMNDLASGKVQPGSSGETRREKQDALKSLIGNKGVSVVGKGDPKGQGKGKGKGKGQERTLEEGDKKGEKFKS